MEGNKAIGKKAGALDRCGVVDIVKIAVSS